MKKVNGRSFFSFCDAVALHAGEELVLEYLGTVRNCWIRLMTPDKCTDYLWGLQQQDA